ncbi:alpha-tocopherol transfer protein-like [Phlebotomus argentipes]|uniref:alpha-tocopherol transfer protein-like n=1 Tax=Phlebotomus argentipes TaxID=94469 RepID=UPI002892A8D2|nr:alpha-tocopherol transfer protein-like [Phlebotomus argentipes]
MALVDLEYDLDEALKRENLTRDNLGKLREPPIPGVPTNITDKQLALFLNACGTVDETRKVIKIYYEARRNSPELFAERDPTRSDIQKCLQCQDYFYLPLTPKGYHVTFHRLSDYKISSYFFENAIKTHFMMIDTCLSKQGPRPGLIFLFDMKGVSLGHLTRVRISTIRKFFHYLQEGLPAKLRAIHVLNVVSFFDKVLALVKPFMKAEIFNMMHLHTSNMDWEEFYEKHIPKSCLPSDFGGDCPSVAEMHEAFKKEVMDLRDYFVSDEKTTFGDQKIENKTQEAQSMFKKLDID